MPRAFKTVTDEHTPGQRPTAKHQRELPSLVALPDDPINTTDLPDPPTDAWGDAIRGVFYRPVKQPESIRLDADIASWLEDDENGSQSRANTILRDRMLAETRKRA